MMIAIDVRIQDKKDADTALFPEIAAAGYAEGALESIGILEGGMESGKPSLWMNVKLTDGSFVCAQVSGDLFESVAAALRGARARWKDAEASESRVPASGRAPEQEGSTPTARKLPDGQFADHWVLSDSERSKGFVRPVRTRYKHSRCGVVTRMGQKIAETYAQDPKFYTQTFCCGCAGYFPVGVNGEFDWDGTSEKVGS